MNPQSPLQQNQNSQHNFSQQQVMPPNQAKKGRKSFLKRIWNTKSVLIIVAILQIIIIVLILNPVALVQQYQNQQIINEVAAKTAVNTAESPVIATITNADQLRSANAAQAQVYKDAQNGDYVLGYSDKMIIYRRGTGEVIYNGDNPNDLVTHTQEKLVSDIVDKAKKQNLISSDSTETPQISIITDVKSLQTANPDFYSIARNNDIVALFPQEQLIVLYNQETSTIVNSGKYSTNISNL